MFTFKKAQKWAMLSIATAALVANTSCKRDDKPVEQALEKPFVVSVGTGTWPNVTYYTVPFSDLMSGELSPVGQGLEQPGYFDFTKIGNTIYSIGGLNDKNVVGIQQNADSSLRRIGDVNFGTQEIMDMVEGDTNTLLAISMVRTSNQIKFYQIGKNSMNVIKDVTVPTSQITAQIPNYPATDHGLEYTGMAVVGNKAFVSYYVINTNIFTTPLIDRAEIAVFSYPEMQFEKLITDDRVGVIGGFNVKNGLIEDENGNIYAVSHTNPANGFTANTKPSGILKIAKGTTSFDANYNFNISAKSNGGNTAHIVYLGNGKAFSEINITPKASQAAWSDGTLKSAVIDFNTQTVNFITGIPEHNGAGRRLALLVENSASSLYLPVSEANDIYYYKINPSNHTATKGAKVKANFVAGTFKF